MADGRFPTTDYGTVVLHWIIVVLFFVLLATGLRIASDDPAYLWLRALDRVLPMEHLWYRHLVSASLLIAALGGYAVYIRRARLTQRVRLDRARLFAMRRGGKAAIGALNGLVLWIMFGAFAVEIVTGVMLFSGIGNGDLAYHMMATWILLAAAGVHVGLHGLYGGARQLLRIVRPGILVIAPPPPDFAELLAEQLRRENATRASAARPQGSPPTLYTPPFAAAVAVGLVILAAAAQLESMTRQELRVIEISRAEAPVLDGDLSDPVWRRAPVASVLTTQGEDFGGTGESRVEVRALHDDEFAYFAFVWADPTRSLKHLPLVKTQDGWHVARSNAGAAGAEASPDPLEDKFSVLLAKSRLPLIGAAIHLSRAPLPDKPPGRTRRGLHYTDGTIADVWQWRASHAGSIGYIENCHFGGPAEPHGLVPDAKSGSYSGGFMRDPEPPVWHENFVAGVAGGTGIVQPLRLPLDPVAMMRAMGPVSDDIKVSEREYSRWWMSEGESRPYPATGGDGIAIGTVMPSIVMLDNPVSEQTGIRGVARWAAGRWTLELARRLHTGSSYDLPIKTGTLMWVAAFDHSETRHTRHLRPLRLEVD